MFLTHYAFLLPHLCNVYRGKLVVNDFTFNSRFSGSGLIAQRPHPGGAGLSSQLTQGLNPGGLNADTPYLLTSQGVNTFITKPFMKNENGNVSQTLMYFNHD